MEQERKINISYKKDEKTNGLGMMIGQYLEQNLDEFEEKVSQALKLQITTSVEVEKGIATTIKFNRNDILIQNGVTGDTNLHLKSSYSVLADVLSGKVNPIKGVMDGRIKLGKIPVSKLFQSLKLLSFLKIPDELLVREQGVPKKVLTPERAFIFLAGAACGIGITYLLKML